VIALIIFDCRKVRNGFFFMAQVMDSHSSLGRSEFFSSIRIEVPQTSKSSTSSSLTPSSASTPSSAASFTRRHFCLAQVTSPPISSFNATSTRSHLFPSDYLEQEVKAKRVFQKLAKESQQTKTDPNPGSDGQVKYLP
jgi:hypothetical protein